MFVVVKPLCFWKSEHDKATCEDRSARNMEKGTFAVTDGVGTASFSNIWAKILAEAFVQTPLVSNDSFEVEWWLRQRQEQFEADESVPKLKDLHLNNKIAAQKAEEGSQSTLATLRITKLANDVATAQLLVFGDSCIFVHKKDDNKVTSFPLEHCDDFKRNPKCLPSRLRYFDRDFHRGEMKKDVEIGVGTRIILATDAVSKWILCHAEGEEQQKAFETIARIPLDPGSDADSADSLEWQQFIQDCRKNDEMVDDDSTALVIEFLGEPPSEGKGERLGIDPQGRDEGREQAFGQARDENNKLLMAVTWGDGEALKKMPGIDVSDEEIKVARDVAEAIREIRHKFAVVIKDSNEPNRSALKEVWDKHVGLNLLKEPAAEALINGLTSQDFDWPWKLGVRESGSEHHIKKENSIHLQEELRRVTTNYPGEFDLDSLKEILRKALDSGLSGDNYIVSSAVNIFIQGAENATYACDIQKFSDWISESELLEDLKHKVREARQICNDQEMNKKQADTAEVTPDSDNTEALPMDSEQQRNDDVSEVVKKQPSEELPGSEWDGNALIHIWQWLKN